ncbi:MAG: hypothetical protein V2A79_18180, partial [Planctomycetota bacterium]
PKHCLVWVCGLDCEPIPCCPDCNDHNPCTADSCGENGCVHAQTDPCCNPGDPCCGNPDRCCQSTNPCCESPDPCCNVNDPCCGSSDRCCNSDNPCCESTDPCCNANDPCCGNSDRCCNADNPCCGSTDPCCNANDPCCGNPDPCCNADNPCCDNPDPCCGVNCDATQCEACDESSGDCVSVCEPGESCCGGECCSQPCCNGVCCPTGETCCSETSCCAPEDCCNGELCCNEGDTCCSGDSSWCCPQGQECCAGSCCLGDCCDPDEGPCCGLCQTCEYVEVQPEEWTWICVSGCPECQRCEIIDDEPACLSDLAQNCNPCGDAGAPPEVCWEGACEARSCGFQVEPASGCAGGDPIEVDVTGPGGGSPCSRPECAGGVELEGEHTEHDLRAWGGVACDGTDGFLFVTIGPGATPGVHTLPLTGSLEGAACGSGSVTVTVESIIDLEFDGLSEAEELDPGGFLCVNDDDDNGNGVPDRQDPEQATAGEDDLRPLTIHPLAPGMTGTVSLSTLAGGERVKFYRNADRSQPVVGGMLDWDTTELPVTLWVEGIGPSSAARDVEVFARYDGPGGPCEDRVRLTVVDAELDPITSGVDPLPINPAVIAPIDTVLDDYSVFNTGNRFELTRLQPSIDLTAIPVYWHLELAPDAFISPLVGFEVSQDYRAIRVVLPFESQTNFGDAQMQFGFGVPSPSRGPCACVPTLIRHIKPDLEPGDFRFSVKAHLCTDGAGTGTTRTEAEIRTIMSDVTKVLSQCGILVTTSAIVTTVVDRDLVDDLGTGWEKLILFAQEEDETAIDVYFVILVDSGVFSGYTLAPYPSLLYEAGIAIADRTLDGELQGQELVRTLAHEVTHYLLNHWSSDDDHRPYEGQNLMYPGTSNSKRDLDEGQCLELRANHGVD